MIISMIGIIFFLVILSVVFIEASNHAPKVSGIETAHFGTNSTCPHYLTASDASRWSCTTCLKADCGFCANADSEVSSFTFSVVWLRFVHAELLNFST